MLPLFEELCIETASMCNRTCPTCLRQSYPSEAPVAFRLKGASFLPSPTVFSILEQARDMGFRGMLNLQFWNEPLMDARLPDFLAYARQLGCFSTIKFCSNADLMTERWGALLTGLVDEIVFALYGSDGGDDIGAARTAREAQIRAWLPGVALTFLGPHSTTHFSPRTTDVAALTAANITRPCTTEVRQRLIIDHRGEMLLCCEDITGEWELGNINTASLENLWQAPRHQQIVDILARAGGRGHFRYCRVCPRV